MESKSENAYIKEYQMIQHLGHMRGLDIFNREIIFKGDFESSNINAVTKLFPSLHFSGCYFHIVYNIMKKSREHTLEEGYRIGVFYTFVLRIRSLCILPKEYIYKDTLEVILEPCKNLFTGDMKNWYDRFVGHLFNTWLGTNTKHLLSQQFLWVSLIRK